MADAPSTPAGEAPEAPQTEATPTTIDNREEYKKTAVVYAAEHPAKEKIIKICCVAGCERPCDTLSFCNRHYQEWLQYGCICTPTFDIKTLDGEEWRDVSGYEGLYKISNFGRLLSMPREVPRHKNGRSITPMRIRAKILKPDIDFKGYCKHGLSKNGTVKVFLVHRLVASAFLPNPNNFPQVNYLDCDPSNNRVDNLEWCNQSMQERHKLYVAKTANPSLINQPVPVRNRNTGEEYPSIALAAEKAGLGYWAFLRLLAVGRADQSGVLWERVVY